ncbi:MAG: CotH kinase family protein [Candidatus Promineofilum sp.]|nr:CotH kinase family protein [Promineifilum sp.]
MKRHRLLLVVALVALLSAVVGVSRLRADAPPVVINELLAGNASATLDPDYKNFVPWVELHNTGGSAVNLGGYRLTDDLDTPTRWIIPSGVTIPAGGYLILWLDGQGSGRHAPYVLGMSGELGLFMPDGTPVDTLTFGPQLSDVAYGRNGSGDWRYYDPATPGAANGSGFATAAQAAPPTLSPPGGFYGSAQAVTLSAAPGATIRYTIDGSRPTANSPVYSVPIAVNGPTAVRARAFAADSLPSPAATSTYLVGVNPNLDVVSLVTDPAYFFDDYIGIYVDGKAGVANPNCGKKVANWNQPWERPVSVELFEADGLVFQQDSGVAIAGSCTRKDPQKQLQLFARPGYGDDDFSAALFADKPFDAYERIILRAAGQDAANTLLRDALGQQLVVGQMDIDRQAYRPAVVFINGAFWGVYGIRERMDEYFVTSNYGLGLDEFDLIEKKSLVLAGSITNWNTLYSYISNNSPATPSVYSYLQTQIDIDEFINYQILEIYSDNIDWPHNNIRWWRAHDDGQWRWMVYDMDAAFGRGTKGYNNNTFKFAAAAKGERAHNALILRRLMLNPTFKAQFGQRFAAHLNTTYQSERVIGVIDDMADTIAPQMPNHIARWNKPKSLAYWQSEVGRLRTYASLRPGHLWGYLNTFLGTPGMVTLTVNHNAARGHVTVEGVAAPAHYQGAHFRTLPLQLAAEPLPGYVFVEWAETGDTDPTPTLVLSGPRTLTAVFEPSP